MTKHKRRAGVIQRKWDADPRFIFAVTNPNGKLAFVAESRDIDTMWADLAHDLVSTPDKLRAGGWRIYPASVHWEEDDD